MAKYIGTYTNETAIQTALNNNELNRPFVALANDTKQVYYGPFVDLAQIGDIVVYDTVRTSLRFIHLVDYNTTTYPTATYEPIGVVCENQTATLAGGVSDVKMMSKNWMCLTDPDNGTTGTFDSSHSRMMNGNGSAFSITTSSSDGKSNTNTLLELCTGQADWRTASTIEEVSNSSPTCECAWRYHTSGTNQGDWYIGSVDEVENTLSSTNGTLINSGLSSIGGAVYYNANVFYSEIFTSTFTGNGRCYTVDCKTTRISNATQINENRYVRALYKGTILPM